VRYGAAKKMFYPISTAARLKQGVPTASKRAGNELGPNVMIDVGPLQSSEIKHLAAA